MPLDQSIMDAMQRWRRHIHQRPECGFDIPMTADFVAERLREFGIETHEAIGKKGVVGVLKSGTGTRSIGLRADMDALFIHEENDFDYASQHHGKMHACGHDGHTAMLLGAAQHLAQNPDFNGIVHFIFQPDEEHGEGAQAMIDDGLFERFPMDEVYGLHNMPGMLEGQFVVRPGSLMASETGFKITIHGQGGHAAMPHRGVDPIVVASQVILGLQTITSRSLSSIEQPGVVSVTNVKTDGTTNVIPNTVWIEGDCRCFDDESLKRIETRMEAIVKGQCVAAGAHYDFEFKNAFIATINSKAETGYALEAAQKALGPENVIGDCEPLTISEDFSRMLRVKPGCYALLGNGVDSVGGCALHNPHYDFNDRILGHGARYWVQLTLDRLV